MRKLIAICAIAAGIVLAQSATTTITTTTAPPRARVLRRLVQTLALTGDQKQQAKTILQTARTQAQPLAQQLQADRQALATAIQAGEPADGSAAMALAEAHRRHLSRWFYECDHERHRSIADLYVCDPRFSRPWEEIAPGFAQYVHDAIFANARRSS